MDQLSEMKPLGGPYKLHCSGLGLWGLEGTRAKQATYKDGEGWLSWYLAYEFISLLYLLKNTFLFKTFCLANKKMSC